jgi:hypothetical protein
VREKIKVIVARRLAWHNGTGKTHSRQRPQGQPDDQQSANRKGS